MNKIFGFRNSFYILALLICASCNEQVEKQWIITNFSQGHVLSLKVPEGKSLISNANIFLEGEFSDTIFMSSIPSDSTVKFTAEQSPERIFSDFYGGQDFKYYVAPSKAKGELRVRIVIP